jgi:hypothetical protein
MKALDLKSVIVAGVIGAALLSLVTLYVGPEGTGTTFAGNAVPTLATGFAIGAGVQVGVRMLGVS